MENCLVQFKICFNLEKTITLSDYFGLERPDIFQNRMPMTGLGLTIEKVDKMALDDLNKILLKEDDETDKEKFEKPSTSKEKKKEKPSTSKGKKKEESKKTESSENKDDDTNEGRGEKRKRRPSLSLVQRFSKLFKKSPKDNSAEEDPNN